MAGIKDSLVRLVESGYNPDDDAELRLKKAALTLVPLIIGPAAFIWGSIYMLLGHPLSGSIPMSYSILSAFTLVYYFKTGKTWFLEKSQLVLVLLLPFLLMWSLGGFFNGSTVMIWALFAPIAASMFMARKDAFKWFMAYMILLLISGILNNYLEANVTPLPDMAITIFFMLNLGAGSAGLYLLTSFTINQERQAVAETQAANEAKTVFLANMSHELRTPLHGILSYSQLGVTRDDSSIDSKAQRYFSQIMKSGERLKTLLDDLLDLSKLEAGKMVLSFSRSDLCEIIKSCIEEQRASSDDRGISINIECDVEPTDIDCDSTRLGQVIMNVLSNAIKFSPDNGVIRLKITESKISYMQHDDIDAILISIADQGPGIPSAELDEIFQKFIQSSKTRKKSGGTGLGLAISRELIALHHGTIGVSNLPEGGAEFVMQLPVKYVDYASETE